MGKGGKVKPEKEIVKLRGEYQHSLDEKGRVSIPARFRDAPDGKRIEKCVITRGLDNCLFLYSLEEWRIYEEKFRSLPTLTDPRVRSFVRFFFSGATECVLDKLGRIAISQSLREYAHLDKEVVVFRMPNRIEIWNKQRWQDYLSETEKSSSQVAQQLSELGIAL